MKNVMFLFTLLCLSCTNNPAPQEGATKIVWDFTESLNNAAQQVSQPAPGVIELTSGPETDYFIEPGVELYEKSNAPLLLRTVDNTRPFTFSFKTTPQHIVKYDAGMTFLYVDSRQWLKFAFETDERLRNRIVTVKTFHSSDDNNHDIVNAASVYLKISSDTHVVGFYYSMDGKEWQLVRLIKNEFPKNLKIGIGAQSPAGQGNNSLFEDLYFAEQSVKDFRLGI